MTRFLGAAAPFLATIPLVAQSALPRTVHFMSEDGRAKLVAYLFEPGSPGPHPAVVLLHGRGGPYSSLAKGVYTSETLTKRHKFWGNYWAEHGYVALLVDSFGPRGYPSGFPKGSHDARPAEVSEEAVRPLDAYAGLRYLKKHHDVDPKRIGVQGWSNGAMTTLVTMSLLSPGVPGDAHANGFRAAIAEYPGCHMPTVQGAYRTYAPILLIVGTNDDEVGYQGCETWARHAKAAGNPIDLVIEQGAMHDFDDPSRSKQEIPANRVATGDMIRRADAFFRKQLK